MEKYIGRLGLKKVWLVAILLLISGCMCPTPPPVDPGPPELDPDPDFPVRVWLTANPSSVNPGGTSTVTIVYHDPEGHLDGRTASLSWTATGGWVSPSSNHPEVTWTAPQAPGIYRVTVDGIYGDYSLSRYVDIAVVLPPPPWEGREDIGVEYWQEVIPDVQ